METNLFTYLGKMRYYFGALLLAKCFLLVEKKKKAVSSAKKMVIYVHDNALPKDARDSFPSQFRAV